MCLAFRSGMFLILNKGKKYNIAVCHDKSMVSASNGQSNLFSVPWRTKGMCIGVVLEVAINRLIGLPRF